MPSRNEIFSKISKQKSTAQDEVRRKLLKDLYEYTNRDTVIYSSGFSSYKAIISKSNIPSSFLSITTQDIQGFMSAFHGLKNDKLDLILHSPGGSLEAAEQIVNYMREKYSEIRAIIPQNAMSAATMIACACDEIIMGKHSAIGPIDPQLIFHDENDRTYSTPAIAILDEFEKAKSELKEDPSTAAIWVRRLDRYPIGIIKNCESTILRSQKTVETWLKNWMFKDEPHSVLPSQIVAWLSDTKEDDSQIRPHNAHGRPICMNEAMQNGLKIVPLENDDELQERVLSVYHATMATHEMSNCTKFIENHQGIGAYLVANLES